MLSSSLSFLLCITNFLLAHSHEHANMLENLPSLQTPFPLCSLHLQTHFSASYVAKFLERAHDHSLFLSLPASLNPTSARLTSLPLHCNRFCLGHQLPIACKIQWSIPCPYLTWFPSIICHSGLLAPWNTFYTWLPGYHSLLVFLLPH